MGLGIGEYLNPLTFCAIYENLRGRGPVAFFSDSPGVYDLKKKNMSRSPDLMVLNVQEAVKLRTRNKKINTQIHKQIKAQTLDLVMIKN